MLAVGADSHGELAHRGAEAVANLLGTSAVTFPGGHGGFLGGEYGQTGEPDAFAARLRDVLTTMADSRSAAERGRRGGSVATW